jgi:hypothetical protein
MLAAVRLAIEKAVINNELRMAVKDTACEL